MLSRVKQTGKNLLAISIAFLFPQVPSEATVLICGEYSPLINIPQAKTDAICGFSDPMSACRASDAVLGNMIIPPTGYTCDNIDCVPGTCHTGVYYLDPGQLVHHNTTNPQDNTDCCTSEWTGGYAKILCTACTHI